MELSEHVWGYDQEESWEGIAASIGHANNCTGLSGQKQPCALTSKNIEVSRTRCAEKIQHFDKKLGKDEKWNERLTATVNQIWLDSRILKMRLQTEKLSSVALYQKSETVQLEDQKLHPRKELLGGPMHEMVKSDVFKKARLKCAENKPARADPEPMGTTPCVVLYFIS